MRVLLKREDNSAFVCVEATEIWYDEDTHLMFVHVGAVRYTLTGVPPYYGTMLVHDTYSSDKLDLTSYPAARSTGIEEAH